MDAFGADAVLADLDASSLEEVLEALLTALEEARSLRREDLPAVRSALRIRERAGATAVGNAVAIPHARVDAVHRMVLGVARIRPPGIGQGPDGQPVRLVFCFLSPRQGSAADHLVLLQRISRAARDPGWVRSCLSASGPEGFAQRLKTGSSARRKREEA